MNDVTVSLEGLSVMIGMPTTRDIHPYTAKSLLATFQRCFERSIPAELGMIVGCGVVQWARDQVVDQFLESKMNRLFWIDSDMVWEPHQFIRLLALSKLVPVVGAAYPAKREGPVFYLHYDADKGLVKDDMGLMEVNGVGLGFTVMQREVVEALASKAPRTIDQINNREIASVFRVDTDEKRNRRGEDIAFFADIKASGYKVMLDPETDLGHIGTKVYTGSIVDALRRA